MDNNHFERIDRMMRSKGIFTHEPTGKTYYTGYEYATLYDWDQYFETIVQLYLGWGTTYARNGVEIFLDLQKENGHIQRSSDAYELYPVQLTEHVKPFLSQICLLIYNRDHSLEFLADNEFFYYNRLKKYILYWLKHPKNYKGLAFWDSAMHTGMDNHHERAGYWQDSFCCGVDLNSYLVRECRAFAKIAEIFGKEADSEEFLRYANQVKQAILEHMWNEADGFFYDIDLRSGEQIKVRYIGVFATMWAEVADEKMAEIMVRNYLQNPKEFNRGFIYPALSAAMEKYTEEYLESDIYMGCNWRACTWIPTNYYVFQGLRNYGYQKEAKHLAQETYEQVVKNGDREYYLTESRKGSGLNPFWGWSLLAYFMPYEEEKNYDPTQIHLTQNEHILLNQKASD